MRLIGTFDTEKEAYILYSSLLKEGIQNVYEPFQDEQQHKKRYRIWVFDEDDLGRSMEWLEKFEQNPNAPEFHHVQIPLVTLPRPTDASAKQDEDLQLPPPPQRLRRKRFHMALTQAIIGICVFLFLWNDLQETEVLQDKGALALQIAFTPLQRALIYDYPSSFKYIDELISIYPIKTFKEVKELPPDAQALFARAEKAPSWRGLYMFFLAVKQEGWEKAKNVPLFEKFDKEKSGGCSLLVFFTAIFSTSFLTWRGPGYWESRSKRGFAVGKSSFSS